MLGFELVKFGSCYESQGNPRDEELKGIEHNCFHMPRYHFCSGIIRTFLRNCLRIHRKLAMKLQSGMPISLLNPYHDC